MDQSTTSFEVIQSLVIPVATVIYPRISLDARKKIVCVEPSIRIRMHPTHSSEQTSTQMDVRTLHQFVFAEPRTKSHCCSGARREFQVRPTGMRFVEINHPATQLPQIGARDW